MTRTPLRPALAAAALAVAALLGACASTEANPVATVTTTPLSDLNLVSAPIPDTLQAAQRAPYRMPDDRSCPALKNDIAALDAVLGADLDTQPTEANPGLVERGGALATDAARRAVEGAIPFRGWVRKLSGAERYSKQVQAATAAGSVRRAFLKGLAGAAAC